MLTPPSKSTLTFTGVGFHLTSAEDPCIEDLQRMSTGGRDYDGSNNNDDIFFSPPGDYSSMTLYKMLDYHSDEDSSMTISSFESSNDFYSYFPPLSPCLVAVAIRNFFWA